MKGKDFVKSKWMKEGAKPETAKKIKDNFRRWSTRVRNTGLSTKAKQLYEFFLSPNVTGMQKILVTGALAYIVSPLDFIPDFIPVVGWLDDIGVAGFALNYIFSTMNQADAAKAAAAEEEVLEAEIDGTGGSSFVDCSVPEAGKSLNCVGPDLSCLQSRLDDLASVAEKLHNDNVRDNVSRISESLKCRRQMRVGFVGRFSTGKSTLLNSLLGKQLLPTSNLPSTKVLTYVMCGKKPCVGVQSRSDGRVSVLDGFDALNGIDPQSVASYAIMYPEYPYGDIVFVDTPGLQDADAETSQQTLDVVPDLDAVVVVLDSNYLEEASGFEFVESMLKTDRDRKLFVVINKVEDKTPETVRRLESLCRANLASRGVSNIRLYSVSAKTGAADAGFVSFAHDLTKFLVNDLRDSVVAHAEAESQAYANMLVGSCADVMRTVGLDAEALRKERAERLAEIDKLAAEYDKQSRESVNKLSQYRSRFFVDFFVFIDGLKATARTWIQGRGLNELRNTDALAVELKGQIVKYVEGRIEEINQSLKLDMAAVQNHIEQYLATLALPMDMKVQDLSLYGKLILPAVVISSLFCGFFVFVKFALIALVGRNFFETAVDDFLGRFGVNAAREKLSEAVSENLDTAKKQLSAKLEESFDLLESQMAASFEEAKKNAISAIRMPETDSSLTPDDVKACRVKLLSFVNGK